LLNVLSGVFAAMALASFSASASAQQGKPIDASAGATASGTTESQDVAAQGTASGDQMGDQPQVTSEDVTRAANSEPGAETPNKLLPEAPLEAPPPPPRHKGLVLESSIGALGFFGKFGSVAPTAFWLHTQLGYEIFKWLMIFGEGEMAFTDTSNAQGPTETRAFPIFGFGGGPRVTVHFTERVAMFVQGDIGAMKSDVTSGALANIGYKNAENLGLYLGGRIGLEWYQIDRHIALGVQLGLRDAFGYKKQIGSDLPLMLDAGLALRYTF
ncbi:MAG: hypothetical protein ACRELY_19240, partial [Polyangiaceae bacterium]